MSAVAEEVSGELISYNPPGPQAANFHAHDGFVRGLMGPVGSGKSSSCCVEIVARALRQRPWIDCIFQPVVDGVSRLTWTRVGADTDLTPGSPCVAPKASVSHLVWTLGRCCFCGSVQHSIFHIKSRCTRRELPFFDSLERTASWGRKRLAHRRTTPMMPIGIEVSKA